MVLPFPPCSFRLLRVRFKYFQLSGQRIPCHFLEAFRSVIVVSEEHDFLGDALADLLDSAVNSLDCYLCSITLSRRHDVQLPPIHWR